ncbi:MULTISPECIES: branched-chain amino acid ABC transporter permease [Rhizobium/Agrobacterium group]|uniref:branched-chain amino acid ABC transporter permease n=1 Tax=Rhizobium/Agrobacterium group TaxID=227290 RepID=UPI001ADCD676|nr:MULTISPECIES: branched-chain amino acid ABC transporter permease [Rhizobium/Agrobacterium group]MBO9112677.1 branched-chain amino acid ABC transporter permease [Agrobacterium sp. S2/73]QXZ76167.1 branched-chain amino acid ABC transporter permease [Agrobacterium sp. S7/73]QYA17284.1 branched-chain amino acid ABC transporter permease [Rhizobium sp. AB2/73]UEQ85599.1 branched-chain amino acid ABC transporter permease [Rhizobium sp. AB2/73]
MLATYIQTLVSGLAIGGVYALIALSFSITFTTTKTMNFAQGEFLSFGAFIGVASLIFFSGLHGNLTAIPGDAVLSWRYPVAATAATVAAGVVGILIFLIAVRPFAGKRGMNWVMSTIGFGVILQSIGLTVWGPAPVMVPSPLGDDIIRIAGAGVRPQELLVLASAIVIMVALDIVMRKTKIGKAMMAVAHSPQTASLMGINVNAIMIGAFALSSGLAGLAGVLIAPIASASLFMGLGFALKAFSGAIIGGLTNPRGCIYGGFILGVLESTVGLWEAQWREIVVFGLIILVLAVRPQGLFGQAAIDKV